MSQHGVLRGAYDNFLGDAPGWYKFTVLSFLIINPLIFYGAGESIGGSIVGWVLLGEFIFTLAMALKCYPLLPGGLIALQAVAIGVTTPDAVMDEVRHNLEVILLLVFMVAGIHFMKDLLLLVFTKLLVRVRSKYLLSSLFCCVSAVLSAFLDALTVAAVIIAIAVGFYTIYHRVASGLSPEDASDITDDGSIGEGREAELQRFRAFLRSLLMHGAIGTALGGVSTMVGEPQNLLIAKEMNWGFVEFAQKMSHVSLPAFFAGLVTCLSLEKLKWFGYGTMMPKAVQKTLQHQDSLATLNRTKKELASLIAQFFVSIFLVVALALHLGEVGLIGLTIIILLTSLTGVNKEHDIGKAFEEALPFAALLVVFFAVVSVIHAQHLFTPFVEMVLAQESAVQTAILFAANGLLSAISDNVFVATVFIGEMKNAFESGSITATTLTEMAVAINAGTNLPSVATPNGQAAFLFILTSAVAPLIHLSYGRMVWMALPYTAVLSTVGFIAIS